MGMGLGIYSKFYMVYTDAPIDGQASVNGS